MTKHLHIFNEISLPLENPVLILSLLFFIIFFVPIITKKINLPEIVGLIIAGMIIGPKGLNLIEKNLAIEIFSTIGLLYIMFISGLEMDINEFLSNKNKSIAFGFYTFFIPLFIGFPICYFLLKYDFLASLIISSMFSTHTLISYPILSKMGLSRHPTIAIVVGGTIITDIAVLFLFTIILTTHNGNLSINYWLMFFLLTLVFIFIMMFIIPRIAKKFLSLLESEKYSQFIFVLSILFFSAFLSKVVGLEPIIGAFAAGLSLNKYIPHSSSLMNRIDFVGTSLFIPFFMISVGMIIDPEIILADLKSIIIAIILTLVAIFSKWFASKLTQFTFKLKNPDGQLIFGLSSAHAAATVAIILIGYEENILDLYILNGVIILIFVTCIFSAILTQRAAKTIIMEDRYEIFAKEKEQKKKEQILLPIANFENLSKLLEFSIFIKEKNLETSISVLSVVENDDFAEKNIKEIKERFKLYSQQYASDTKDIQIITTIDSNIVRGILRVSREIFANIIVLGWPKRPGYIEKLIGEKLEHILDNTTISVFICHFEKSLINYKKLVIIVPPLAEYEVGFTDWLMKLINLSRELTMFIEVYGNVLTNDAIKNFLNKIKFNSNVNFINYYSWEDIIENIPDVKEEDLVVVVSSRKNSISYLPIMQHLPVKMEKLFYKNSRILIYPNEFDGLK